jgi:hypothetical protein
MLAEIVVSKKLAEIAADNEFIFTPDRRDQKEATNQAVVSVQLISSDGDHTLAGDSMLDRTRVQVTVTSPRKRNALQVCRIIRDHLSGFRGEVTTTDYGTLFCSDCQYVGSRAVYDPPSDGGQAGDYSHSLDFSVTMAG